MDIIDALFEQHAMYHLALLILLGLLAEAVGGLSLLKFGFSGMVYCTIGLWYFVDPVYRPSGYDQVQPSEFSFCYSQVILFLVSFRILVQTLIPNTPSSTLRSFDPRLLSRSRMVASLILAWAVLFGIGMARVDFQFVKVLLPLDARSGWGAQMWHRGRLGGAFSFLVSAADYFYMFICAVFGLIAVSTQKANIRRTMVAMMCLTWPMFLLDGTRHKAIAVTLPAIFGVLVMNPWTRTKKIAFLGVCFCTLNVIMLVVITYRNVGLDNYFQPGGVALSEMKHEGLNMTEELIYLNRYHEQGLMQPDMGGNYLAHCLNVIPRPLWPEKPEIGMKFAILRVGLYQGQAAATISNGIIGQGVTNFGGIFGPAAPALIMALFGRWICLLPRRGNKFLRICLVLVCLAAIVNFGRDITMFSSWPIVFGFIAIRVFEKAGPPALPYTSPARPLAKARQRRSAQRQP